MWQNYHIKLSVFLAMASIAQKLKKYEQNRPANDTKRQHFNKINNRTFWKKTNEPQKS